MIFFFFFFFFFFTSRNILFRRITSGLPPEHVRAALHTVLAVVSPTTRTKMGIQLKVHGPKGEEKIIDLCDSDRELRKITVTQLMSKLSHELNMTSKYCRGEVNGNLMHLMYLCPG